MKTKGIRFSKRAISMILSVLMVVSCFVVGTIFTVNAADVDLQNGYLYFDASGTNFDTSHHVNIIYYHEEPSDNSDAKKCYYKRMAHLDGTKLYYISASSINYDNAYIAFFSGDWNTSEETNWKNIYDNCLDMTNRYASSFAMNNSNSVYLVTASGNTKAYNLSLSCLGTDSTASTRYGYLNKTLTVKTMYLSGTSYAETTTKYGSFSATNAKKMNGNGTTTSSSFSQSTGTGTLVTARTNVAIISQSANSGYTFKGWKSSKDTTGSGLSTGEYSYTNSGSDATIYAYYEQTETTYDVAVSAGTGGTISPSTSPISVGATTPVALPTATPSYGYKFVNWTATGDVTIANPTNASGATVTATGTGGSVTANFAPDDNMTIYIRGRFRYKATPSSDWTFTGNNFGDWSDSDSSTNIQMTYTGSGTVYKLDTNATLAQLSAKSGNDLPYFHLNVSGTNYYPASNTPAATSPGTELGTTGPNNMYFSSDSTQGPVTIYYNTVTKKIWYDLPASYTINVNGGDHGTVSTSTVVANNVSAATLPTPTPAYGYKFVRWTTTDSRFTINNPTSADSATVTTTQTSNSPTGTVTATYEVDTTMNLYIAGRFHVRTSLSSEWYNTFDSGDWNATCTKSQLKLNYDANGEYSINTYASLKNLTDTISSQNPVFFIYDQTNDKALRSATSFTFTNSNKGTKHTLTEYASNTTTNNANMRFNDQNTYQPVTIHFKPLTKEIWYTIPNYYTVTLNSTSNGTYTVNSNSSTYEEAEAVRVTISASPAENYELGTVTVVQTSGGSSVTTSREGNIVTFTMPSSAVTISVSFTRKRYSYTAVASPAAAATISPNSGTLDAGTYVNLSIPSTEYNSTYGGYVFKNWTTSTGYFGTSGTTTTTTASPNFYPTETGAVATANFARVRKITLASASHTDNLTITYRDYNNTEQTLTAGSSAYALVDSTLTVNVTPSYGYKVTSVSDGTTTDTSSPYSFTVSWATSALTYTATIAEDTSTSWQLWYRKGNDDSTQQTVPFVKNSGETTGKIAYYTASSIVASSEYQFKVIGQGNVWYTANTTVTDEAETTFSTTGGSNNNTKFNSTAAGSYKFKIDFSTSTSPKVTVIFPSLTVTYNTLSNATYGTQTTEAKAGQTVTFKVMPTDTYYVSTVTVSPDANNITIADTIDSGGYIDCSFTMPLSDATVTVGTATLTLSATVNTRSGGYVSDILDSSGVSVNPTRTDGTGTATADSRFKIGDTYKIVVTAVSNAYTLEQADLVNNSGSGLNCSSMTPNGNTYTFTCTVMNKPIDVKAKFRAVAPVISTAGKVTNLTVDKPFTLSQIVDCTPYTSVSYKIGSGSTISATNGLNTQVTVSTRGQVNITVYFTNAPNGIDSTNSAVSTQSAQQTLTITFDYAQAYAWFYVETHGVSVSSLSYVVYSDSACTNVMKNSSNQNYQGTLTAQSGVDADGTITATGSSVYGKDAALPYVDNGGNPINVKFTLVTTTGLTKTSVVSIAKNQLVEDEHKDFWFEVVSKAEDNRASISLKRTYKNNTMTYHSYKLNSNVPLTNDATHNEIKRVYISIPSSQTNWTSTPTIYFWNDDDENVAPSWTDTSDVLKLKKLGVSGSDVLYYVDIPAAATKIIVRGNTVSKQTGDTTLNKNNYFEWKGNRKVMTKKTDVVDPLISKYYSTVYLNITDTGTKAVNIAPDYKKEDGMQVVYSIDSTYSSYLTVSPDGTLTPLMDTYDSIDAEIRANGIPVTITLKSKLDALFTTPNNTDRDSVTVHVFITDPNTIHDLTVMSYETDTTKVYINNITGGEYPAYISKVKTKLSGTATGLNYNVGAAVVTLEDDNHTAVIKYAKPSSQSFPSGYTGTYAGITVQAQIIAQENGEDASTHHRYGFYDWYEDVGTLTSANFATYISGHTKSDTYRARDAYIGANGTNYIMHFDTYDYTDIIVTFSYQTYKALVNGVYKYYFDADKINDPNYHETKTYSATFEVAYKSGSVAEINGSTTVNDIWRYVIQSARNVKNDYYTYSFAQANTSIGTHVQDSGKSFYRQLNVNVELQKTPREYTVRYNDGSSVSTVDTVYYQGYVTVSSGGDASVKWIDSASGIVLATIPDYRFRVTGDITLRSEAMGVNDTNYSDGLKTVADYANSEIEEKAVTTTTGGVTTTKYVEYLVQNFQINSFYNQEMIKHASKVATSDDYGDITYTDGDPIPYDDITFVGGGVFYYSADATTGKPAKDFAITAGYVNNSGTYDTNTENVGERLLDIISGQDIETAHPNLIEEDKVRAAFGTEIKETVDYVRGQSTGLVYRYLPFTTVAYKTVGEGTVDEYETIDDSTSVTNKQTYTYSLTLGAYQYIYPVKVKNIADNTNVKIKLHSYYIYSYLDYENDPNGETIYGIVVSDDAATANRFENADYIVS